MKRLFAGLFAAALLGGTGGSAQAQSLTIGFTIDLSCFGFGSGGCPTQNGGGSYCRTCFVPGWSPEYPKPMMYSGMSASPACQGGYCAPYGGYSYAPSPMGYGYGQGYGWMPPAAPATPKISTVPPPEPATGSPK